MGAILREKVKEIVKRKINNSEVTDDAINELINEVEHFIKEYCNVDAVPDGLLYTWANMAYEVHMKKSAIQFGDSSAIGSETGSASNENAVKSFSVDGIGMTFVTAAEQEGQQTKNYEAYKNVENLLLNYAYMLDKYRKLVW